MIERMNGKQEAFASCLFNMYACHFRQMIETQIVLHT